MCARVCTNVDVGALLKVRDCWESPMRGIHTHLSVTIEIRWFEVKTTKKKEVSWNELCCVVP